MVKRYIWNVLISLDQLGNTILGGDPDETISSRLGKKEREGSKIAKWACSILNKFDHCHCKNSIEEDEGIKRN